MPIFSLKSITSPEFDYNFLIHLLRGYKRPNDKIGELLNGGEIIRVKKGIYVLPGLGPSLPLLANMIYGPSYVSREYALSIYKLIPERVYQVTSMTTGKNKRFETPLGVFTYTHLSHQAYQEGITIYKIEDERECIVATPEKALADRIFKEKFMSAKDAGLFVTEGLRIETSDLKKFNLKRMRSIENAYKKKSVTLLFDFIRGLK